MAKLIGKDDPKSSPGIPVADLCTDRHFLEVAAEAIG